MDEDGSSDGAAAADTGVSADVDVTMAAAMAAMELAEAMAAGLGDLAALSSGGKEHLMDPRMVNMGKMRGALLPSANLYASALGLARCAAYVALDGGSGGAAGNVVAPDADLVSIGDVAYHPGAVQVAHNAGLRLFKFQRDAGGASGRRTLQATAVGSASLGGSTVFVDMARGVTVAVTVNRLTADRALTAHLLDIIAEELQLGVPVDL